MGGVGVDVATELASQIRYRGENAARKDLAFDLSEPDLDLVEPRGIGRGKVKLHARMLLEEISNRLRFRSGEVVEDDMNLLPGGAQRHDFFQEGEEVATGVTSRSFSVHPAGPGIQRGIQRERAMAVVLKSMTLGPSRRKRQNGVQPIQSLNRGLLIDAEDGRVLRRIIQLRRAVESVSAWACYRPGRQPSAFINRKLLGRLRQLPDQLFVFSLSYTFRLASNGHREHTGGEREHSIALELPPGQRSVLYLYSRPAFRQSGRREPAPILRKSLCYQVHILLASMR